MSNSTNCSEQKTLDREREIYQEEIVRQLTEIVDRLDRLEQALTDKLNEAYQQGVADERKHRTGRDLKVADDD
jgi:exonuclease VII small subunit